MFFLRASINFPENESFKVEGSEAALMWGFNLNTVK